MKPYLKLAGFLILLMIVIAELTAYKGAPLPSPAPSVATTPSPTPFTNQKEQKNSLESIIQNTLENTNGTYGIVVKNLKTNEVYSANEHKAFEAASLYKLWVMAEAYKQIQDGSLKEDEMLKGTITLSVHDALDQMITISDNYSALLLTQRIGSPKISSFLNENGFNESRLEGNSPITTAYDTALFFEKLYKGKLANEQYTSEMIALLKAQERNDKLPKYLPQDTLIAHKTGEIDTFTHDAGIVYAPNGNYIIAIFSENDSPTEGSEKIAEISKAVYDYFITLTVHINQS